MIDEKKLMKDLQFAIKSNALHLNADTDAMEDYYNEVAAGLIDAIDIVADQPKTGEWIPCSKEYPPPLPNYESYLISEPVQVTYLSYYEKKPMCGISAVYCETSNTWYWWDGEAYEDEVEVEIVAWKPLDEPYQFTDVDKMVEMEGEQE